MGINKKQYATPTIQPLGAFSQVTRGNTGSFQDNNQTGVGNDMVMAPN